MVWVRIKKARGEVTYYGVVAKRLSVTPVKQVKLSPLAEIVETVVCGHYGTYDPGDIGLLVLRSCAAADDVATEGTDGFKWSHDSPPTAGRMFGRKRLPADLFIKNEEGADHK